MCHIIVILKLSLCLSEALKKVLHGGSVADGTFCVCNSISFDNPQPLGEKQFQTMTEHPLSVSGEQYMYQLKSQMHLSDLSLVFVVFFFFLRSWLLVALPLL